MKKMRSWQQPLVAQWKQPAPPTAARARPLGRSSTHSSSTCSSCTHSSCTHSSRTHSSSTHSSTHGSSITYSRGRRMAARAATVSELQQQQALPATRQAWWIVRPGDVGSMELREEPMPRLEQAQQVLVEVRALGLNMADVFCALGLYKAAPNGAFIPGLEFSGVVVDGGGHCYNPGDRVLGVLRFGAFASHVKVPAEYLRRVLDDWSFEQGAAFAVQALTAAYALFVCGQLGGGQLGAGRRRPTVLVQSAAGGVGLAALHILSRLPHGANVLGLVGSPAKAEMLAQRFSPRSSCVGDAAGAGAGTAAAAAGAAAGAAAAAAAGAAAGAADVAPAPHVEFQARLPPGARADAISEQLRGFLARSAAHSGGGGSSASPGGGFDVVLDSLGGGYFTPSWQALGPAGRHVVFGAGSLTPPPGLRLSLPGLLASPASLVGAARLLAGWLGRPRVDALALPGENKGILGFNLIYLYDRLDVLDALYERLEALALPPPLVGRVFGIAELPAALQFLQSGESVGKVVVTLQPQQPQAHGGGGGE